MSSVVGKKIIFDFDGVIVNSFAMTLALTRKIDSASISDSEYRALFAGNIFETGASRKFSTFDNAATKAAYYREYGDGLSKLFVVPGMDSLVREAARRYPLYIVSSADEVSINNFLRRHSLDDCFQSVLGYESAESKVEKFKMLNVHHQPGNHLFVTDTLGDLKEAAMINLPAIAVSWGVHGADQLILGRPREIVDTVDALSSALAR